MPNESHFDLDEDAQDGESTSMTTSLTSRELQQLLDANRASAVKQAGEQSVLDEIDVRNAARLAQQKSAAPAKPAAPKSSHPAAHLFQNPRIEEDLAELLTPPQKERVRQAKARDEELDMTAVLTPQQLMTLKLLQEDRAARGEDEPLTNWWEIIPAWGWILIALAGGTLVTGTALRLTMASSADVLLLAGAGCLVLGALILLTTHVLAYAKAVQSNDKIGLFDIFLKPITIWQPTFRKLPETQWRVILGGWSIALLFTALILGGKNLMSLADKQWVEKKAERNMLHEIVEKAQNAEAAEGSEEMSMEEALNEFTGAAEDQTKEPEEKAEEEKVDISKWPRMDCLIIGYVPDPNGDFESLILASVIKDQLQYVGIVTPKELTVVERSQLYKRLTDPALARETSLLKSPVGGNWIRPLMMCRVAFDELKNGEMGQAVLTDLLQDIE